MGALAAELMFTRFTLAAAAVEIRRPVSTEPVKEILSTSRCSTRPAPATAPLPWSTLNTPGGRPRLGGQLAEAHRRHRRLLGGLEDHRVAGGQRTGRGPLQERRRSAAREVEIRRRARDIVIMISRTRKEGHGAHCSSVVVEILPLVKVVGAGGVTRVAGVDYERRFLEKDSLRDETLGVAERIAPSAIAEDDEFERAGSGGSEARFACGAHVDPINAGRVEVVGVGTQAR